MAQLKLPTAARGLPQYVRASAILPRDFKFTYPLDTELWTVVRWAAVEASPRGAIMFNGAVARLKPGVPLAAAVARMADVPARLNGSSVPVEP